MKNNKNKMDDFRQFKTKIFIRTLIMVAAAIVILWLIYFFVVYGRFADAIVALLQAIFHIDYNAAWNIYQRIFNNYYDIIMLIAVAVIFLIIFKFFLGWLIKYFQEINRGIDGLIEEETGEIILSPELTAVEKKLNRIKNTLEKRKSDAQLAEQRKNDLVVYLAHDLKTPLTSVIGYLSLLRDERQISEDLQEKYLAISLEKAERLEYLINEFFEITRFNLTSITLERSHVNLTRMLEQLTFEFRPMLLEKKLNCSLNTAPDISVKCDANNIQRVFDNLLQNAVYYSFESSTIEINVRPEEDKIVVDFINHGNTIPREKLERVFDQFYRLDASRSSNSGGAGLGLAIAKEIVELHSGTITAQSENEVTLFQVSLPL